MKFLALLLNFLAVLTFSHSASAQISPLPVIDAELRANFPNIDSIDGDRLQKMLDDGHNPILLDVREPDEYGVSHIKGAIRIDPDAALTDILRVIGADMKGRDVVVYCSVGVRSTQLAHRFASDLQQRGVRNIANLSQGIFGWHNSRRPLERGGRATPYVHPYNALWGQLIMRQSLTAYSPLEAGNRSMATLGINELALRLLTFLGVFSLLAIAETLRPRRIRQLSRGQRWLAHFGMLGLATLLVRSVILLLPLVGATAAARFAAQHGWGLFNLVEFPLWLEIGCAVILLDLAIWTQHVVTHHVPLLWRFHSIHHIDRDFDASSALRFHPVEILFSAFYKLALILILGPATLAVIAFEMLLNASAMFNHANWALPEKLDQVLRLVVVTPDMHRIHHSVIRAEHDRNFGFCLSIWDRLFGTYKAMPDFGHDAMTVGLQPWQDDDRPARLGWLLRQPFIDQKS